MTEKPITDIAWVAAFGGEFSSYPWMPQSKSVCEELHAASASRMSLGWCLVKQAKHSAHQVEHCGWLCPICSTAGNQ